MITYARINQTYLGSDGEATKALYAEIAAHGPAGEIAVNLIRAHKTSSRAKLYRRGPGHKTASYDRKDWSLSNLATLLGTHGDEMGIRWGWAKDKTREFHNIILYVDLPTGQVSFHTGTRREGPDYPGEWDRVRDVGAYRICAWTSSLFGATDIPPPPWRPSDPEPVTAPEHKQEVLL